MPPPFELYKPLQRSSGLGIRGIRPISGLGRKVPQNPLQPFLPSEEEIQAAQQEKEDEGGSIFFDILKVPERLLFGQSIKAAAAGAAEGPLEAIGGFIQKNPLFQILDILPGVDITGKDVDFADIREAWGDKDAREGFENLVYNFVGELLTDPLGTLWTPFGKAGAIARGVDIPASLAKGVKVADRTLAAFKVPWGPEFTIEAMRFKGLDVAVAHQVDRIANWWHTSPLTSPIARKFGNTPPLADPEQRAAFRILNQAHKEKAEGVGQYFYTMFGRLFRKNPEVFKNESPAVQEAFLALSEVGVGRADTLESMVQKVLDGPQWARAQRSRAKLLAEDKGAQELMGKIQEEFLDPIARGATHRSLRGEAPKVGAIKTWQKRYGRTSLPEEVLALGEERLALYKIELRPQIDIRRTRGEIPALDVLLSEKTNLADITGASARRLEIGQTVPSPQERAIAEADRHTLDVLRTLHKDDPNLLQKIKEASEDAQFLVQELGTAERMSGILNTVLEPYIPHDIIPEVRELLDARWGQFFQGRKLSDMSLFEVNQFVRDYGSKVTGGRALKTVSLDPADTTVQKIMSRVFDAPFLRSLKNHPDKAIRSQAQEAVKFFETNPAHIFFNRIGKSVRAQYRTGFLRGLLDPETSAFIEGDSVLGDIARHAEEAANGNVALILSRDGESWKYRKASGMEVYEPGLRLDARSKEELATQRIYATIQDGIKTRTKGLQQSMDELRSVRSFSVDTPMEELLSSNSNLARVLVRQKDLLDEKRLFEGIKGTVDERVAALKGYLREVQENIKEITAEQKASRALSKGRRVPGRALSPADRELEGLHKLEAQLSAEVGRIPRRSLSGVFQESEDLAIQIGNFGAELRSLRKAERYERQAIASMLREGKAHRRSLLDNVKARLRATKSELREITDEAIENSPSFQRELDLHFLHGKEGVLALDELKALFPEQAERLIKRSAVDAPVVYMKKDTYDKLLGPGGAVEALFAPDRSMLAGGTFDWMTQFWKAWTVLPPFFLKRFIRDVGSSTLMQIQGGQSPIGAVREAFGDGWKVARSVGKYIRGEAPELATEVITRGVDDATLTYKELLEATQSHGIINNSLYRDEFYVDRTETVSRLRAKKTFEGGSKDFFANMLKLNPDENSIIQTGAQFAEFGDNWVKLNGVISRWKAGDTLEDAIQATKAYAYDPARIDLSNFERYTLKRILPFYTWLKRSFQIQTQVYLERPGAQAFWEKLHTAALNSQGLTEAEYEQVVPEFIQSNFGIPIKRKKDGTALYSLFGGYLPQTDVGKLADAIEATFSSKNKGNIVDFLGERLNPIFRVPIETALNRSFYSRREFENPVGERGEMFGVVMPKRVINIFRSVRLLNEIDELNILNFGDVTRLLAGVERSYDKRTFLERVRSTGFSPVPEPGVAEVRYGEEISRRRITADVETRLLKGKLRRTIERGETPTTKATADVVRRAIAEKLANIRILDEVRERFGLPAEDQ